MKRQFLASVYQEGDWFIAEAHEVAVASQGKTEEEALANLKEALELYFEPPTATSHSQTGRGNRGRYCSRLGRWPIGKLCVNWRRRIFTEVEPKRKPRQIQRS